MKLGIYPIPIDTLSKLFFLTGKKNSITLVFKEDSHNLYFLMQLRKQTKIHFK